MDIQWFLTTSDMTTSIYLAKSPLINVIVIGPLLDESDGCSQETCAAGFRWTASGF